MDELRGKVENSIWPRDAKTVFVFAIDVHLEKWHSNMSLRADKKETHGKDHRASAENFESEQLQMGMEEDDTFFEYLETVRKRANAVLNGKERSRARARSMNSLDVKMQDRFADGTV